jgi:hypothetical protein
LLQTGTITDLSRPTRTSQAHMTVVSGCSPVKAEEPMSGLTESTFHRDLDERVG